ncbi:hypothetical protein JL720_7813 [Aureococcus anophagefferens]|nr:hypothetical protein JL720_7813 [Aureococcus anophagefferens]
MAKAERAAELPPAEGAAALAESESAAELPPADDAAAPELPPLEADDGYDDGYDDDEEDDFFAPPAEDAPVKSRKRKLEEAIAAQHVSAHSLERDYKETAPPPPAEADARRADAEAELAARRRGRGRAHQAELARDYPGRHQKPKPAPGVDKRSIAPGQKDRKGKPVTFNSKEKRSRAARGDNDYVQEEKRILRQATDGYAMGY